MALRRRDSYIITPHAKWQMTRRDIDEDMVRSVMASPGQRQAAGAGREIYQSRIARGSPSKEYLLRVVVDIERSPVEVVTLYCTTKIEKYWRDT